MNDQIEKILKSGGITIIPTDTIYGIVGSALNPKAVEKIYDLRQRQKTKPMIVLIGSFADLKHFNISISEEDKKVLEKIWPGKVSVILPCPDEKFKYLHRGKNSIAFRMPDSKNLTALLSYAGPLVAPSANIEGEPPATTIEEAKKYFGDKVDLYEDNGIITCESSTLTELQNGKLKILRQGGVQIDKALLSE